MTINQLCAEAYITSTANGFEHTNVPGMLALIHSEVSEALEAHRKPQQFIKQYLDTVFPDGWYQERGRFWDANFTVTEGPSITEFSVFETAKELQKQAFASELADVIIRVFDLAASQNIDLETSTLAKMAYNKSRPYKHGKAY